MFPGHLDFLHAWKDVRSVVAAGHREMADNGPEGGKGDEKRELLCANRAMQWQKCGKRSCPYSTPMAGTQEDSQPSRKDHDVTVSLAQTATAITG
jgi:hypothetical protein